MREPPAHPHVPDYELLREIGRGSYGVVWLARSVTGLYRAVKIVWRESFEEPQPYEREFRGIREFAAISLQTPRQLALLHVGRNDAAGFFYYVMELADDADTGRDIDPARYRANTLKEVAQRRGRFPAAEAIALGVELAEGLAELHRHGLVHRDIKPSNIIFAGGAPKLADIGLIAAARTTDLTLSRVGNAGYMPPDFPGTASADAYGLGKVLYELVTARPRDDFPALPPDLGTYPDRKELLELNEILLRACAPNPEKRYANAGALVDELRLLQAGKSVRRLRATERHLARALRVAAVLAIVASVAGVGAWVEHRRAASETDQRIRAERDRDAIARRSIYGATLAQAQRAIESSDYGRARRLLVGDATKPGDADLRGIEWRSLLEQATGDECVRLREEGPPIDKLALSPDQRVLAVHDEHKNVALYDVESGREVRRIEGVQRLAGFSEDGRWLVGTTTKPASSPQRWLVATGARELATPPNHPIRPLALFDPDQMLGVLDPSPAASGSDASHGSRLSLGLWDFTEGKLMAKWSLDEAHTGAPWEFFRAAVETNIKELVIGCVKGRGPLVRFRLTHVTFGQSPTLRHTELEGFLPSMIASVRDRGGARRWIVAESATGRQLELEPLTGQWVPISQRAPLGITAAIQLHSGAQFVAHNAQISRLTDGTATDRRFRGHESLIATIVATENSRHLFSASQSGELRRWYAGTPNPPARSRQCWNSSATPTGLVFSPDAATLFVPRDGTTVSALHTDTLEEKTLIEDMRWPLTIRQNEVWGVSANVQAVVCWDQATRQQVQRIEFDGKTISRAVISASGSWCGVVTDDGKLTVLDLRRDSREKRVVPGAFLDTWIGVIADDGRRFWAGSRNSNLSCFDASDGRTVWQVPLPSRSTSLCRLPQARRIAVALETGEVKLFDESTGQPVQTILSGSSAAQALQPTPDENRLIAGGNDGQFHVLAPDWGVYLAPLASGGADAMHVVAVAPNGNILACLTKSGMLRLATGK